MNIHWYPGHMRKTKILIQDNLKIVDMVIEVVDARVPLSSKNPDIQKWTKNKKRILLLNKSDLVKKEELEKWKKYFKEENKADEILEISAKTGENLKELFKLIGKAEKEKTLKMQKKGVRNTTLRMLVAGIPNVGKSHIINKLVKRKAAGVGDRPGFTKGKQWIKIKKGLELLDTPGILWPKFESKIVGLHLAITGAIKDEILDTSKLTNEFVNIIKDKKEGKNLVEKYRIKEEDLQKSSEEIIEQIALSLGMLRTGGVPDINKAELLIIRDYRANKLGKLVLDKVNMDMK